MSEALGETVREDEPEYDTRRRGFQEARAATVAEGTSPGGWVRAESEGLVHWRVTIQRGTTQRLSEEAFLDEARGAVQALLANFYAKMTDLKDEFFDLRLPDDAGA